MRVCLVTWWASRNCGTCLQAYALMRALEGLGCKVHFSDLNQPRFKFKYWVRLVSSIAGVAALLTLVRRIASRRAAENESYRRLQTWVNSTFRVMRLKYPWSLKQLVVTTDCFVSGSDQIWNTYYEGFSPHMFLDIVGESKRISYASSIGTTGVNPIYEEDVKKWLSKYVQIGVREKTGMQILRELTGRNDIVQVVDPVFLLSADDWRGFESFDRSSLREKYVLCYVLGDNPSYSEEVLRVARESKIDRIVVMTSSERPDFKIPGAEIIENVIPPEFVALISHASVVCTDSFHATALSMIMNREFVAFRRFPDDGGKSQNSRIYDLLDDFDLGDRLFDAKSCGSRAAISWEHVGALIEDKRRQAFSFLREGLFD